MRLADINMRPKILLGIFSPLLLLIFFAGQEAYLQPYDSGKQHVQSQFNALRQTVSDNPPQVARLWDAESILHEWQDKATQADEFTIMADRIRANIEALKIPHANNTAAPVVTTSIGMMVTPYDNTEEPKAIYHAADEALYRAKEAGRNRVEVSTPSSQKNILSRTG